jgi:Restriction endonuclease
MKKINPTNVLFIKLGTNGGWNTECIEKEQTIKVGFYEISHDILVTKNWSSVKNHYKANKVSPQWVSIYTNQLKTFYTADENTLWVTFHKGKLWWAFAEMQVYTTPEGAKFRKVIGKWSSTNINGDELFMENLSGQILKVQGFRSTICNVYASEYITRKINAEEIKEIKEVIENYAKLQKSIEPMIRKLNPDDFELLVDLIFRDLGYQRVSVIGKQQKTKDIELLARVSGERSVIQVKCQSSFKVFEDYVVRFEELIDYDKCYFVVHTPDKKLDEYESQDDRIVLWKMKELSKFCINGGLIDWIINKIN